MDKPQNNKQNRQLNNKPGQGNKPMQGNKPAQGKAQAPRLKPSMRDKERYIAYEIQSKEPLGYNADKAVVAEISSLLGVFMSAKANPKSMKYNPEKQRGILRVVRKYQEHIKACFPMIKHINNKEVIVRTLRVSGMISKLKDKLE
ncbi:ribonuclease P protein component 2 [Candidatus Woesearchaeota archaeon]|nr:ribonuclease P protein component 2 [Candidatus Woesearchaeota archaeon]